MARTLNSILLSGPEGPLEALLQEPESPDKIDRIAVICHPHPQYGGTMHNKVVYRMARSARTEAAAVLRFNFRGVGRSAGTYDGGRGEQDDLRAAMRYMLDRYPGKPITIGGFSFGSRISLRACCGEPGVDRIVAVGTPVNTHDWSFLSQCGCPKAFFHSTNDEFGSRAAMERVFEFAADPKTLTWIEAQDHFFVDRLDALEDALRTAWR